MRTTPVLALLLACAAPVRADIPALEPAAATSFSAASSASADQAKGQAGSSFDGNRFTSQAPAGRGSERIVTASGLDPAAPRTSMHRPNQGPPATTGEPEEGKKPSWLSHGLIYGGAMVIGGVQGYLKAGLGGALLGAGLGFGAAYLYSKHEYGAAFGWTLGGIIGGAMGGPIGALLGAAIGAGIGMLVQKLFT